MKQIFLLLVILSFSVYADKIPSNFKKETRPQISFTENKGQVCDQNYKPRTDVLFSGTDGQLTFHIKNNGISYQLNRIDSWKEENISPLKGMSDVDGRGMSKVPDQTTIYRIDANWLNTNPNCIKQPDEALSGCNNYYLEQCPNGALNVKSYKGITLKNIYNNINLHYYEKEGVLKYDYIVAPHSDYKQIQIEILGAEIKLQRDGSLLLKTPFGDVQEGKPVAYQNGKRLQTRWKVKNNILSFEVENYDSDFELIIDPPTRIWGTYYGDSGYDNGFSVTTDVTGNVYMSGVVGGSGTLIATIGTHQSSFGGGSNDAFLVKFNTSGIRQWGTYFGGSGDDLGNACKVDAKGNLFLAGTTSSTNTAMTTLGAYQTLYGGGFRDAFLAKFNTSGIRIWSTFLGGAGADYGNCFTFDLNGNLYVGGETDSPSGISTPTSHQPSYYALNDAFLVQFDSLGSLQWGTYYGGTNAERGWGCTTDKFGDVYLSGRSASSGGTIIATSGSHQSFFGGGTLDAFLVKFSSTGVRKWATYYGGMGDEGGYSCATDTASNVFLAGWTGSTGFLIATSGAHQASLSGPYDALLVKFNSNGVRQWGTYCGGTQNDYGYSVTTEKDGDVYLCGWTNSSSGSGVATLGSHQSAYGGGINDAMLVKFNSVGVRQWGTYYGGNLGENCFSCSVDSIGNVYITGGTETVLGTAISTSGAHQLTHAGGTNDGYLARFNDCYPNQPGAISGTNSLCSGSGIQTYSITSVIGANSYNWSLPGGWIGTSTTNVISVTTGTNSGTMSITATNTCGTTPATVLSITINPQPAVTATTSNTLICGPPFPGTASLTANGAISYTWNTSSTTSVIAVSPSVTTTYSVTGTATNGCQNTATITQSVSACTSFQEIKFESSEFEIFPNPTNGFVTVLVPNSTKESIEVYNVIGETIFKTEIKQNKTEIDLSKQASGIYFIRAGNSSRKVIKQ